MILKSWEKMQSPFLETGFRKLVIFTKTTDSRKSNETRFPPAQSRLHCENLLPANLHGKATFARVSLDFAAATEMPSSSAISFVE